MEKIDLILPPKLKECYSFLLENGASPQLCIFGGAVRDSDNKSAEPIKDYDFRVWFQKEEAAQVFVKNLTRYGCRIENCIGSHHLRYVTTFQNIELDISYRIVSDTSISQVAKERAAKADIGLSAVAIDSQFQGWCTPEYALDKTYKTLTVYPNSNKHQVKSYVRRMRRKYPNHDVIFWL